MKARQYLETLASTERVTFIKARARKDANTPMYHEEYQTTPIWMAAEWLRGNSKTLESVILNDKQMPINWLSGADWGEWVKAGHLRCLLVISPEDFELLVPSKEQRESIESYIDEKIEI